MEGKNGWVINSSEEILSIFQNGQTAVFGHTYKIICCPVDVGSSYHWPLLISPTCLLTNPFPLPLVFPLSAKAYSYDSIFNKAGAGVSKIFIYAVAEVGGG